MKNEEQDINFNLIQPFCILICFVMIVLFHFFLYGTIAFHFIFFW